MSRRCILVGSNLTITVKTDIETDEELDAKTEEIYETVADRLYDTNLFRDFEYTGVSAEDGEVICSFYVEELAECLYEPATRFSDGCFEIEGVEDRDIERKLKYPGYEIKADLEHVRHKDYVA